MAILVTGGAGYIGAHLCVELIDKGYEVVVIDNFVNSDLAVFERIQRIVAKKPVVYEVDLLDLDAVRSVFASHHFEAVIHLGGLKAVGESVRLPLDYYIANVTGTIYLCEVMKEYGIKNLVFSSSATVYGIPESVPLTEDMRCEATNPYGRTKFMVENILRDLCISDKDWSISLLRYFNPIGAHPSGLIGESPKGEPNNLMPFITQVAVGKRSELYVFGNDYDTIDGTGVRDYIHVVDLARGHVKALEFVQMNTGVETINLGTGRGYSVLEVVSAFVKASGQSIPFKIVDRRPGDIAVCYADPSKAERILGWKAEKGLDEMCTDAWRWQQGNPSGYEEDTSQYSVLNR